MTVQAAEILQYQRYAGYLDPRYPAGFWHCATEVTGDLTGGSAVLTLVLAEAADAALNSRIYSLEEMSVTSTNVAGSGNAALRFINVSGPTNLPLDLTLVVALATTPGTGVAEAVLARDLVFMPLLIGSQRDLGTQAGIIMSLANANGVIFSFSGQGYWWDKRSVLADGGPQRPPNGLFRA